MPDSLSWLQSLSRLGDSIFLLPLSLAFFVSLWKVRSPSAAGWFMAALAACIATIATLKIAFLACGPAWHSDIVTPSAHAAIAFTVYGSVALAAERTQRRWLAPVLAMLVLGIAVSRVVLRAHTQAEVVIGLTVGCAATLLFAWLNGRSEHERKLPLLPLLAAGAVIAITLHSVYLPLEELASDIALQTRGRWFDCRLP